MTRDELIEALRRGDALAYDTQVSHLAGAGDGFPNAEKSLDAALSLKDEMLPGWGWGVVGANFGEQSTAFIKSPKGVKTREKAPRPQPPFASLSLRQWRR